MKVDIKKLVKPTTYAKKIGVSDVYIYKLIKQKKIDFVVIDGTKFIKLK